MHAHAAPAIATPPHDTVRGGYPDEEFLARLPCLQKNPS
jgi:hypothetical protein